MDCGEFQKGLAYVIDGGGSAEQAEHLKTCAACTDLVEDLKHIAAQAPLLVPMHDPSPRVWAGIQASLEREGLVQPSAHRFQPALIPHAAQQWSSFARWGAVAALALIAFLVISHRNPVPGGGTQATKIDSAAGSGALDANDQKLLAVVSQQRPGSADLYKRSLNDVNSYIADAQKSLDQDPNNDEAREHLLRAYDQKAMLYDMATAQPTE
jgi:hypothetical protein